MEKEIYNNIKKKLINTLIVLLDAKEEKNITEDNKEIALYDLFKILNLYISSNDKMNLSLTKSQELWFYSILEAQKKIKYPILKISTGLFRCYIITLFKLQGKLDELEKETGWNVSMLKREQNYDMKKFLLSVEKTYNESLKNNKEEK